jgi:hypothetical protein
MAQQLLTLDDLKAQLNDIGERFPALKDDERFLVWFLHAYVTDSEVAAVESRTGQSGDQGIDALLVDTNSRAVFVVQGKYRQKLFGKSESRADILTFAQLAKSLTDDDTTAFDALIENANEHVAERIKDARRKLRREGYRLWLYYITLGKCSAGLFEQARQTVRNNYSDTRIELFDAKRVLSLLVDYLDGVAPPIPSLDLPMETGSGVTLKQVFHRYDHPNDVDCWVFTVRGDALAEIYARTGLRLFARNIRGFLGETTPVNRGMVATLRSEPDHFFYYNNGITILCDKAESTEHKGTQFLHVENPQVINGQQTSRVLAGHPKEAAKASVLVKVMQVPRDPQIQGNEFDDLLSRIVQGTNWQNAISPSDLMSNDRKQIELERNLRKVGCVYIRKRETKADTRRRLGNPGYTVIKKTEMAQAVASCDLDPAVLRQGKDSLFEEDHYDVVFPTSDPWFYIPRYWLMSDVAYHTRRRRALTHAKWIVVNFLWMKLGAFLRTKSISLKYHEVHIHRHWDPLRKLDRAIPAVLKASTDFFRRYRGTGEEQHDLSSFFRIRGRHKQFDAWWSSPKNPRRKTTDALLSAFENALGSYEAE